MNLEEPRNFISQQAKVLLSADGEVGAAIKLADGQHMSRRVLGLLRSKTGVAGGTTGDNDFGSVLSDIKIASDAFFASLTTQSVFCRMLDGGIRRTPMRTHIGAVALGISAYAVGEGKAMPLSRLSLRNPELTPHKVAAMVAFSTEVAKSSDPAALALIDTELRNAVATVLDADFFNLLTDTSMSSTHSIGNTVDDVRSDLKTLLDAVNACGVGQLFWCAAPDVANAASTMEWPVGTVSPTGGELCHLPFLVSDTIAPGVLRLVNASAICGNVGTIDIALAGQAGIQMADASSMDAGGPTIGPMVSLWQSNMVAVRAAVSFAAEKIRADAVAELTGIDWGATGT